MRNDDNDSPKSNVWGNIGFADPFDSGGLRHGGNGEGADHSERQGKSVPASRPDRDTKFANVADGHWDEAFDTVAEAASQGDSDRLDVQLESAARSGLRVINQILAHTIDFNDRKAVEIQAKVAIGAVMAQVRVDESRLRARESSTMQQTIARFLEVKAARDLQLAARI